MRHLVFVLVLAAAAFAGGALVNGPGLAWVRQNVIGGPTVVADGGPAPAGRPPRRFPTASPNPLLLGELPTPTPPLPTAAPARPLASAPAPPSPVLAPTLEGLAAPGAPTGGRDLATASGRPGLPSATAPSDPPLERPSDPAPKADATTRLTSVGDATPDAPAPAQAPDLSAGTGPSPAGDWASIRNRLRELGASRYRVEADLAGRVRFSCVIPVEGLHAVGHHFEAEGDDEFQAAEATLRRVTLWRATEPPRANR